MRRQRPPCHAVGGSGHGLALARAHRLEGPRDAEHAEVVEAAPDDLQADRQALVVDNRN